MVETEINEIHSPLFPPPKAINTELMMPYEGMPILPQNIQGFVKAWKDDGYPEPLLYKLLSNLCHIREQDFNHAVQEMADVLTKREKGKKFVFMSYQINESSGRFMYDRIKPHLKDKGQLPEKVVDYVRGILPSQSSSTLEEIKGNGYDVVIVDDAAFSARGQYSEVVEGLVKAGIPREKISDF